MTARGTGNAFKSRQIKIGNWQRELRKKLGRFTLKHLKKDIDIAEPPKPSDVLSAREKTGLTQQDAATMIYATRSAWARWEAGERAMHPAFFELFLLKTQIFKTTRLLL